MRSNYHKGSSLVIMDSFGYACTRQGVKRTTPFTVVDAGVAQIVRDKYIPL